MPIPRPPYLGAAYYPEDWPLEQVDADVALMKQAGMNCMRVAEFAWYSMEPEEGCYQFDWLHIVVEKLGAAGIAVIMGTPSATPPIWLVDRYPEVLWVGDDGRPSGHGARRHVCPNNGVYRDYCARIVTRMAEEFGHDERILGWQVDNEVYPPIWPGRSCSCPICLRLFQKRMREQFGSIEALNDAWCLTLWSQAYQSFDQIPAVRRDVWHHPSLLAAWSEFASDSYAQYVKHQADIIHRLADQPVGTDMMPFEGVDYHRMHEALDMVQFNHYNGMDDLWRPAFWFDFMRTLKPTPFWNTETQTGWNGSVAINAGTKDPGWCRVNSWLPVALGGEANLYWLWRQHWAGQELMHGSVVSSCGRPLYMFDEVQQLSRDFEAAGELVRETTPTQSGLAVMWSQRVGRMAYFQPIMANLDYQLTIQERVYLPLLEAQLRPDVIVPQADLSPYKVIVCSCLFTLDEAGVRERLLEWVKAGGTLLIGPLSDVRNIESAKYTHAPFGSLEEWTGVYCRQSLPGMPKDWTVQYEDGRAATGGLWYDGLEPRGSEALATYVDGPNAGLAAITRTAVGQGAIIMLGTLPQPTDLALLTKEACAAQGIAPVAEASGNVVVVPRRGTEKTGTVLVEIRNQPGYVEVASPRRDLLTGNTVQGRVEMPPFSVMVLEG
jgi:beta-galactosidase